jgi:S1-C subfamily serine protease
LIGDILLAVQGKPVEDHDSLMVALAGDVVGKTVEVTVLRGGQEQTLNVTVGERT